MLPDYPHQEIHTWFTLPDLVTSPARLNQYRSMLSGAETDQYQRFHFPGDAHRYLIAHALVRTILSKYADIQPDCWTFSHGPHGRPEIKNQDIPALRFNLTHTENLVGCVVTLENDCGIDAEKISPRHNPLGIAKRMFSDTEFRELQQLEDVARLEYFFKRWTLREAYVKALGIGISFPTRKLTFTVDKDSSVEVSFHPDIEDRQDNWHFHLLKPTAEHIAAIAIRRNGGVDKKIVTRFIDLQRGKIDPVPTGS
jgi:4'-phosphopantetheinyl transferase